MSTSFLQALFHHSNLFKWLVTCAFDCFSHGEFPSLYQLAFLATGTPLQQGHLGLETQLETWEVSKTQLAYMGNRSQDLHLERKETYDPSGYGTSILDCHSFIADTKRHHSTCFLPFALFVCLFVLLSPEDLIKICLCLHLISLCCLLWSCFV